MKKALIQKKVNTIYKAAREAVQPRTAEDRKWERSFAQSHDVLRDLAAEAREDRKAGRTRPIDPDRM